MVRGLYTSGWSMRALDRKMDVISNNMANAHTNGYKKDTVVMEGFPRELALRINDYSEAGSRNGKIGNITSGHDIGTIHTDYRQGNLIATGRSLDVSIDDGNYNNQAAFFTVSKADENGNPDEYYTRNGSFALNSDNQLVTMDGDLVMGVNGPIVLSDEKFSIDNDGNVIQDGFFVDRLKITRFEDATTLKKFGNNLLQRTESSEVINFEGEIRQGTLERSNVNIVSEMVEMINVMRSYEANQKIIQIQDQSLEKAVNQVGAIR